MQNILELWGSQRMAGFLSCVLRKSVRRYRAAERGSVAVEMALLMPVFLLLFMGSIETCLMLGAQTLMESAAYNTSRLGKTGYSASGQTQAQTVNQTMVTELQSYGLIDTTRLTTTETSYNSFASIGAGGTAGYGTEEQIVVYTITYPWKLVTPINGLLQILNLGSIGTDGVINLTASIVVRNEPYG